MEALGSLNSCGFLSRDIKPANIRLACKNSGSAPEVETLRSVLPTTISSKKEDSI